MYGKGGNREHQKGDGSDGDRVSPCRARAEEHLLEKALLIVSHSAANEPVDNMIKDFGSDAWWIKIKKDTTPRPPLCLMRVKYRAVANLSELSLSEMDPNRKEEILLEQEVMTSFILPDGMEGKFEAKINTAFIHSFGKAVKGYNDVKGYTDHTGDTLIQKFDGKHHVRL